MEISDFGTVFAAGYTLSVEQRSALEVQLAKKRIEERLHRCVDFAQFMREELAWNLFVGRV